MPKKATSFCVFWKDFDLRGQERVGDIPERRHDVQLLNDTILSIKAPGAETFP